MKKRLNSCNHAARLFPWFVLTDLNGLSRCPVELMNDWLPEKESGMCFRIAVCQMESWLNASRESLSRYLQISLDIIPLNPETIEYPKNKLVQLASRSRSREIVRDMVRDNNKVGIAYPSRIIEFTSKYWDIDEARRHSDSLDRCIIALERVKTSIELQLFPLGKGFCFAFRPRDYLSHRRQY